MKQKIALLVSVLMLSVSLVACGRKNDKTPNGGMGVSPAPNVSDTGIPNDSDEGGGAGGTDRDEGFDYKDDHKYHDHDGTNSDGGNLIQDGENIIDDTLDGIGDAIDDAANGMDEAVTDTGNQNTRTNRNSK